MTKEKPAPRGAGGVIALHAERMRILDRLTGAPVVHAPPLTKSGRLELVARGRALERRIEEARSRSTEEVALKLKLAASGLLLTGQWERLVDSAARDLEAPEPGSPLARIVRRKR